MKSTGIIRKMDDLGRILIPKEIRKRAGIAVDEPMEIFCEDGKVILRKYLQESHMHEEHNNGWILCSERLPENRENVLVCWGGNNISVGYFVNGGAGGWFFEPLAGGYKIPYEPFAWQPLPEPYKPQN